MVPVASSRLGFVIRSQPKVTFAVSFENRKRVLPDIFSAADVDKKSRADLADEVKRVSEAWETLKYMIGELPPEQAAKVAALAASSLGWLKEGE